MTPTRSRSGSGRTACRRCSAKLDEVLAATEPYDLATLEKAVHAYAESHGHPMGDVVNPLRVATTGQGVGPGLYDCLVILGRDACRGRIASTLAMLRGRQSA